VSHEPSSQSITREDMQCLLPRQWLNDGVRQTKDKKQIYSSLKALFFPA